MILPAAILSILALISLLLNLVLIMPVCIIFMNAVKEEFFYMMHDHLSPEDYERLRKMKTSDLKIILMFAWLLLAFITGLLRQLLW